VFRSTRASLSGLTSAFGPRASAQRSPEIRISGSKQAPVLITFTRNSTAIFAGELKKDFKYLQGSTITVSDPGGDLNGYWFDHPATDPIDRRFLINLPDYWMDRYEVTNREFKLFVDA
jgi:hypothetical protein